MVTRIGGDLVRRDRQDLRRRGVDQNGEYYLAVNEPHLYYQDALDDEAPDGYETVLAEHVHAFASELPVAECGSLTLQTSVGTKSEADLWGQWSSTAPHLLWLKTGGSKAGSQMALRLARAHGAKGKPFVIDSEGGRASTKFLQGACSSSASYLLLRKQGILTNLRDAFKYDLAQTKSKVVPESLTGAGGSQLEAFPAEVETEVQSPELAEEEDPPLEVAVRVPTNEEKESLGKLHRNLGHPGNKELCRALRVAGAPEHLCKYAKEHFRCPTCAANRAPKSVRPSMIPRAYAPNTVVGVDLLQLSNWNSTEQFWMLNMLCLGTSFQMVERVRSKEPEEVWAAFARTWGRFLGWPQVLLLDQGTEFLSEFRSRASSLGIVLHTIGARAPHQNGRTQRHGGLFKALFERARWENPPTSHEDWRLLLRETESAKNRLFNRSGYSPAQRMLGQTGRTVGEIFSDDALDPAFLEPTEDLQRLLSIRQSAQKAFVELNTSEAMKTALRARSRVQRQFLPGEIVFVWRSWKVRGVMKPSWVGPGVVLLPEGANSYVNVRGRLWKVCNEHLRPGTSEEIKGVEAIHEVFKDMKDRFDRASLKLVEDHTRDPLPDGRFEAKMLDKGSLKLTKKGWNEERRGLEPRSLKLLFRCLLWRWNRPRRQELKQNQRHQFHSKPKTCRSAPTVEQASNQSQSWRLRQLPQSYLPGASVRPSFGRSRCSLEWTQCVRTKDATAPQAAPFDLQCFFLGVHRTLRTDRCGKARGPDPTAG